MPDPIFADPRLASLYDVFDGLRLDLEAYLGIAREVAARSILDIGCGTGCFAILAAADGIAVTAVDPAAASLDLARAKPGADAVAWHEGTVDSLPDLVVDLGVMTGNVAQVFLTDDEWLATLAAIRRRLGPTGHLVFETRRAQARAWEQWKRDEGEVTAQVQGVGVVRQRFELREVALPFVSFRYTYTFPDGASVASDSTLRFRDEGEVERSLAATGFRIVDVRDAPDRPGLEHVYVAAPAMTG